MLKFGVRKDDRLKIMKNLGRSLFTELDELSGKLIVSVLYLGIAHYRDGRDSRFADAGGIAERVAFCRYH